jgi:4-amino-4-deoxy-L-arabinose transferase-like glycosyltransferase
MRYKMNLQGQFFYRKQTPFILLTLSAIVWLICFPLFQDGMFMDGVQYAAVSRNLARGTGTFWFPVFSENSVAGLDTFHEHPPLVFFIQSIFFKIFGLNNIYPERIYCLFTFTVAAFFIVLIWRKIFEDNSEIRNLFWLPVLLWVVMPVVFWSYANNIQENTVTVFTTAAIYFFLVSVNSVSVLRNIFFYFGITAIILAVLSKGLPGLFPVVFFIAFALAIKRISIKKAIVVTLIMLLIISLVFLLILLLPQAKSSLHIWFFDRMLFRIENNPVTENHFKILMDLFTEQLPSILICCFSVLLFKTKKIDYKHFNNHTVLFWFLLGCCGSLPLVLTKVQRAFYFTPALPMFAIGWSIFIAHGIGNWQKIYLQSKTIIRASVILFSIALLSGLLFTVIYSGKPKRSELLLQDVYTIGNTIAADSKVCVSDEIMWNNWAFRCYMMRYNSISFSTDGSCEYFIGTRNSEQRLTSADYELNLFYIKQYK